MLSVKERIHRFKTGRTQATKSNKENLAKILSMLDDRLSKLEPPKPKPEVKK